MVQGNVVPHVAGNDSYMGKEIGSCVWEAERQCSQRWMHLNKFSMFSKNKKESCHIMVLILLLIEGVAKLAVS